ncbi:MAG: carboxypeptidase regulatory-like domain-containing protein, partial [Acidobacteriota bacterium]
MLLSKPGVFFFIIAAQFLSIASTCWAQQAAGSTKSAEKPNGIITGRVVNSAGEPLSGASVYAGSLGTSTRSQRATVDANGEFKLDGLEAGLYRVSAGAPGYVMAVQPSPTESQSYYHIGDSITVRLIKGAVITGTVTGPKGPLVAVGVFAIRVRDEADNPLTSSMGLHERATDDRGVYRFYGLLPGGYLISAAKPRIGLVAPTAYDNDAPTYFPSSRRDTASEVGVREGEEITADIQYRAEPGHAISGKVVGFVESQTQYSPGVSINLTDMRDRSSLVGTQASPNDNFSFAIYGVPDGEYELSSLQFLQTRDEFRSPPRRVTVRGADVSGMILTLAPPASIEGRLVIENDPKASCGKRRETAAQETIVFGHRYEPEKKAGVAAKTASLADVSLSATNYVSTGVGDANASFTLKNLPPGSYRIDPRPPASGWYVRSIAIRAGESVAARAASLVAARDGIILKSGERVSGLTVTITEGAASIRGRISAAAGQSLPPGMRLYLVPAERDSSENLLRFFEETVATDGTFAIGNLAPGRYWMIAQPAVESDSNSVKSIKSDSVFRSKV